MSILRIIELLQVTKNLLKIIRLDTIDSTNSFLKELAISSDIQNFTVVVAKNQISGRGQVQSKWLVESGKNLTFSIFCVFNNLPIQEQKYLNFAVSLSVFETLKTLQLPRLAIKWPNDILSERNKICGVLIENVLKKQYIKSSVIGIGINVNQEVFSDDLPNASSIKNILDKEFDLDVLLESVLDKLKIMLSLLENKDYKILERKYLNALYKKNVPSMFRTSRNVLFMGKIFGVSQEGKLQIQLDDESIQEFGIKEVSFASL